ncbi:TPA: beta-ketoacyl synthase N-terminal-like domain-containing protein [Staphylococcus aureus]
MSDGISCITGIGTVNALGINTDEFFSNLFLGKSGLTDSKNIQINTGSLSYVAYVFEDFKKNLNKRVVKQSDRFIHLALVATKEAIEKRSSDVEYVPLKKGVFFGNNSGGWDICERGFFEFFTKSPKLVNPYQATAWFPTAPQGFTSIVYNFKGYSKSGSVAKLIL